MADLIDFPILINFTDIDLQNKARSDGYDIIFTESDGETTLDHEIESYKSSTGALLAWVKIPYLSSTVDTVIHMYYGNPNAIDQQNVEGVWSNGYVGVYHMLEDSGSINNSASGTNDGTRFNTPIRTTGKVGYGQEFTGSGADDYFNLGDLGIADGINENITFSTWANIDDSSLENDAKIICKRNSTDDDYLYAFTFDSDPVDKDIELGLNGASGSLQEVAKSTWVYLVGTYDGSNMIFYINATNVDQEARSGALFASSKNVTIGSRKRDGLPADRNFGGILDEIRFSDIARSDGWITTEFNNQNDTSIFYTVGDEEIDKNNWLYRKPITINSTQVMDNLIDFPILINITDPDLLDKARLDGYDIVFTQSNGRTRLDHEVESYNSSTGELFAWVRIPVLSSTADTVIYMYYGNPEIVSSMENPNGVWDSNYIMVQHLNENPTESAPQFIDSTFYNNNGTGYGMTSADLVSGKIDGALELDEFNDYIEVPHSQSLNITDYITLESWVKTPSNGFWDIIISKGNWNDSYGYYVFTDNVIWYTLNDTDINTGENFGNNTWAHLVFTYNGSYVNIYLNGSLVYSVPRTGPINTTDKPLYIGRTEVADYYNGTIDEVRISNVARSAAWITTEFNNQNSSDTFYTLGNEEVIGTGTNYEWVELYNADTIPVDLTGWKLSDNDGNTFNLSGAGTIPVGGYLICHLGQTGINSSSDLYGSIINSGSTPKHMLENIDDLALINSTDDIIDYVAWGGNPGADATDAVAESEWSPDQYVDTTGLYEGETLGRDKDSTDTDTPSDWENSTTTRADPFGVNATSETPGRQNCDLIIPEFNILAIPIMFITILMFCFNRYYNSNSNSNQGTSRKKRRNKLKNKR
jgi:hypothetical protein